MEEKIIQLASEILNAPQSELTIDSSMDTVDNWDSLAHIQLIAEIEDEFKISIPFEDVAEITSLKDFLKYIG